MENEIKKRYILFARLRITFLIVWLVICIVITYLIVRFLQKKGIPIELGYRDLAAIFAGLVASGALIFNAINVHLSVKANYEKLNFDREKLLYDKKQNVFKIIEDFNSKSFIQYSTKMRDFLDKHAALDTVAFGMALDNDSEARVAVAAFLNEMERIALIYKQGVGDNDLLYEFFQDIFISYYRRYSFYIKVRREKIGSDNIFDTFEVVVKEWELLRNKK